jgi:hypothetical protein
LNWFTVGNYKVGNLWSQIAGNPSQIAGNPSQIASNPSQIAGNPSQIASNPSQIASALVILKFRMSRQITFKNSMSCRAFRKTVEWLLVVIG